MKKRPSESMGELGGGNCRKSCESRCLKGLKSAGGTCDGGAVSKANITVSTVGVSLSTIQTLLALVNTMAKSVA